MALRLAGWSRATPVIGPERRELAPIIPPLLPEEQRLPGVKVLKRPKLFAIGEGLILASESPGLGLDVGEEAIGNGMT
jgi:hypothetical protein